MKKQLIVTALVASTMLGGAFSAQAFLEPGDDCGGARSGKKMNPEKHLARMAEKLKLSDAQKAQIQGIFKAEQERVAPLKEQLAENRKALRQWGEAETFDEAAVKSLAEKQASLQSEMIVSRMKVRNQIHALLTPEQRELAKKMGPMHGGKGHKGKGPF